MNKKIISVLFLFILIAVIVFLMRSYRSNTEIVRRAEEAAVRTLVENFGHSLKNVSLLSPYAREDIESNYKNFLDPALLDEWKSDPSKALGRLVSSPWPEKIEISSISKFGLKAYDVSGKIIEMTSTGMSGSHPIQIAVAKFDNRWLITGVYALPYQVSEPWKEYESDGISFEYPETLGAEYISETEWPPTIVIKPGNYACEETPAGSSYATPIVSQKVINGRIYCVAVSHEGAAGSVYSSYSYASPRNGRLVELSFVLRYPNCLNYPEDQARTCADERETFDLDALVNSVFQTLKFESASNTLADQIARCLVSSYSADAEKCEELMEQITDFDSCVMAGFPIIGSGPLRCQAANGKIFVQGTNSSWEEAVSAIDNCEAASAFQTHSLIVTVTLKDNRRLIVAEPKIDDIFDIAAAAEAKCGRIQIATE
ncbi:MAG TPA: hypothetical protein PLH22_02305 [Candidatus Colwellbacteria bacterium]|nr:hypothetical protein [Candidatus Colwellbacteria bacterium]